VRDESKAREVKAVKKYEKKIAAEFEKKHRIPPGSGY